MAKPLPMTAEDWKPFLNQGEVLRWYGRSALRYYLPFLAVGALIFGSGTILYGNAAFFYSDVQSYCASHHFSGCSRFFSVRWLMLIGSLSVVLMASYFIATMLLGWLRHNFAITDRRALLVMDAPFPKMRAKLYEADYILQRPHISMGSIKFGNSTSAVRFFGLSQKQRSAILDSVSEIAGEQKQ